MRGYACELPQSGNQHFLTVWPMNFMYDLMVKWGFNQVSHEVLLQTSHTFIKVRFALIVCYAVANRVHQIINARNKFMKS